MTARSIILGVVIILLFNLFSMARVCSQQLLFSDSLGLFENNRFSTIAGTLHQNYVVIECLPGNSPQYLLLDSNCRLIKRDTLSFIPPGGFIKSAIIENNNSCSILWQSLQGNSWYLHNTWISGDGQTISRSALIDSAVLPASIRLRPYFVRESAQHQYQLLFRRLPDPDNSQLEVELMIINTGSGKVQRGQLLVPFNKEFDITSDVTIDDNGNVFTAVFDNPLNFRLSSTIHLYRFSPRAGQVNYPPIASREKKPTGLLIQPGEFNHQLLLVALYYDFYKKNVDGIAGALVSETSLQSDSLFYFSFPKELKKKINRNISGISNDKAMNFLELKECRVNAQNGVTILLELYHQSFTSFGDNVPVNRQSLPPGNANDNANFPLQQSAGGINRGGRRGGRNITSFNDPVPGNLQQRPFAGIDNGLPGQALQQNNGFQGVSAVSIPIQHVSILASFDGLFHIANNKVLQDQLTSRTGYLAPYTSIKSGLLQQLVYDYTSSKTLVKQTATAFLDDSLSQQQHIVTNRQLILLNHAGAYAGNSFLLTFYHNTVTNSYGLAKLRWQ